jgi:hypothetical protein
MTDTRYSRTVAVLTEVMAERAAQDRTWGEQNHPLHDPVAPDGVVLMGRSYAALEQMMKARFAEHRSGAVILLEEVFEALAARNLRDARDELVQVAAVAVMLVEGIDRARAAGQTAADRRGNVRPCDTVASPLVTGEGTRRYPVGEADDDHPRAGYRADLVIEDDPELSGEAEGRWIDAVKVTLDGVSDFDRERLAVGQHVTPEEIDANYAKDLVEDAPPSTVHHHNFDRLHGICRCGEPSDSPVHADEGGE